MRTAREAVGCMSLTAPCSTSQKLLKSAVNSRGAVSPAAPATANMTPVRMAGRAVGSTILQMTWLRVQPIPYAASRVMRDTVFIASSAVSTTVGTINTARATAPAGAEYVPVTSTTLAYAKTPARIDGSPVRVLAARRTAPARGL